MAPQIQGLYVIVDPAACRGRRAADVARLALEGGARVIQWRDKARSAAEQVADAAAVRDVCRAFDAVFIVNDFPELAREIEADGVHLGQSDANIEAARPIVGPDMIIGVSTNNEREALAAQSAGAGYVAVGAIFPTRTKRDTRGANLERLHQVEVAVHIPVVAIGGINASNLQDVINAGAQSAAVISAVCGANDPRAAARELSAMFDAGARLGGHTV